MGSSRKLANWEDRDLFFSSSTPTPRFGYKMHEPSFGLAEFVQSDIVIVRITSVEPERGVGPNEYQPDKTVGLRS
jgi:hypothetical protein